MSNMIAVSDAVAELRISGLSRRERIDLGRAVKQAAWWDRVISRRARRLSGEVNTFPETWLLGIVKNLLCPEDERQYKIPC